MKELSRIARGVRASTTMAIDSLYKQMKAEGQDVIGFAAGEPDFNTPDHIKEAAYQAIRDNFTRYTPASGMVELKQAACDRMKADCGVDYTPAQVVIASGAKHMVYLALRALVNPGDEVILPTPAWVSYYELIRIVGGIPVMLPASEEEDFKITPEKLEQAITTQTKAIILNNPSNPTGMVYDAGQLQALADVCVRHDLYIIADEIYYGLLYDGKTFTSIASLGEEVKRRTILVNGVSKSYAMTGWRMGYLCGPAPLIKQMLKLHQFGIMSAPTTSQYAAIEAMRNGDRDIEKMRDEYDGRRHGGAHRVPGRGLHHAGSFSGPPGLHGGAYEPDPRGKLYSPRGRFLRHDEHSKADRADPRRRHDPGRQRFCHRLFETGPCGGRARRRLWRSRLCPLVLRHLHGKYQGGSGSAGSLFGKLIS